VSLSRRDFLSKVGIAAASFAAGSNSSFAGNGRKSKQPNILFIMTDQQHFGMMSCTGNKHLNTPAMDSIAEEGIRFERAYAANPVCVPSRIAMATGVMPGRMGVFANGTRAKVPEIVDNNSLGKLIKRAGYDTFYGGKTHMCPELEPRKAGYDIFDKESREGLPDACIEFIKAKRNKPFFAIASFINPHDICFAYSAYLGKAGKNNKTNVDKLYRQASALRPKQLPPLPNNYAIQKDEPEGIELSCNPNAVTPPAKMRADYDQRQWQINRWIYCRLTEVVDNHIGRILNALKAARLEEQTLIVFTSDHGNMDASHRLASKGFFYEESVRVPFLMKYKGTIPAKRVDAEHLVSTGLDILPTLCDYASIEPPKSLLGKSLRTIAEDRHLDNWRTFVVSENHSGRMLRTERYKYCLYNAGKERESLVDMKLDPGEMKNLAQDPKYKDVLNDHRRYLRQWIKESKDTEAKEFALGASEI
jgi:arylsulfatase A-like enzyme